ncbi:MAG: pantoate--beta-alanine ligase [Coriobacteriia bacterium]|nr:pantoate--beta-alanine ligase [Coriobacteriia bacterium]
MIERLSSKDEIRAAVAAARREGKRVGFVPTMGALHAGHLSLVSAACKRADVVVTSIFVNPTQFGPSEDFAAYPRSLESDIALLSGDGVEIVFTPSAAEMYGELPVVTVDPGPLAARWEGAVRPGHFSGVATVVTKLLSVVRPDIAFFGEKDYQQLQIVKRLVADLDVGCQIVGCATVRDEDGLALSSRNVHLSSEQRVAALALPAALEAAELAVAWGERSAAAIEAGMRDTVARLAGDALLLDYAAVVDASSLEPVVELRGCVRAIIAGRIGPTRLIDNCALDASECEAAHA